ncbi:hypothetical protein Zmor_004921 [Zophobas morio]|uniref:Uncharacterized protein n=1 Tax=Zophobas morio TaxID=2755281 RepID=A0AA38MLW2_9CUCU|nr:hypothetical protein Zmor_004921 [Zophobas morio]
MVTRPVDGGGAPDSAGRRGRCMAELYRASAKCALNLAFNALQIRQESPGDGAGADGGESDRALACRRNRRPMRDLEA